MAKSLEESLALFESIRDFFYNEKKLELVIEISDGPMAEWRITQVHSLDEAVDARSELIIQKKDFAGFMPFEGHYNFYFVDKNMYKVQNTDSGKIIKFSDYTRPTYNLKLLLKEIKEFQGS
jgi:hypothetical protein